MPATVTFDGTRVNASDANTNWGNYSSSGSAPAAEPQLAYQGGLTVNKKINETTGRGGIDYDPGAGALDMTAAANKLWFAKAKVADAGDLNATYGCELAIGSSNADFYSYNVAGTGSARPVYDVYEGQGGPAEGYLITCIDPEIAAWRDSTTGTPVLTAVDWYAFAAQFVTGGAKSENIALDAIDVGRGLIYTGTADDGFQDAVDIDQGNTSNRWGAANAVGRAIFLRGLHQLATATALTFTDTRTVFFPDGYHSSGSFGIVVDLQNASTNVQLNGIYISEGLATTEDTRAILRVTGTAGSFSVAGRLANFNTIELTSACTVTGDIAFADLTQNGALLDGATLRTDSAANVAACNDADFTKLVDARFVQEGLGHAVEVAGTTAFTINGTVFSGYGADASNSAALFFSATSGTIDVTLAAGTPTPTFRSAGVTVNFISAQTLTITGLADDTQVSIRRVSDNTELFFDPDVGVDGSTSYSYGAALVGTSVRLVIISLDEEPLSVPVSLASGDQTIPIVQSNDRNYLNP